MKNQWTATVVVTRNGVPLSIKTEKFTSQVAAENWSETIADHIAGKRKDSDLTVLSFTIGEESS